MQAIKQDYNTTDMDLSKMAATLQDPSQIGLVKEIMEKMG